MNSLIVYFSVFFILSFLLKKLWVSSLSQKSYMVIAFFGILVHELSHLVFCLIFRAKVEKAKLFSANGGYVVCGNPKIPLGKFFIGFAPIIGGVSILYFLFKIFNLGFDLSQISNWKFWVFLFLSSSILSYIAPSRADLKASFFGLMIFFLTIFILNYFGIQIPEFIYQNLNQLFLMMIKIEILSIGLGLLFWVIKPLKRLRHV
jgi:hypothetical protein